MPKRFYAEIPPTAGLPLRLADLLPPWRGDFGRAAAQYIGVEHYGLACSGTAAFIVILTALSRQSTRRKVIVPAYTCPLVVLAIAHCGLQTVLCDVAENSFEFDISKLRALSDEETLAIVPTHLAGRVAEIEVVQAIATACGASVIEDAAQAFGAKSDDQSLGLAGDAGFFSFAVGKGLSLFEGGLWITRNPALARAFQHAGQEVLAKDRLKEFTRSLELAGYFAFYRPALLYWVYGRPLSQGVLSGQLEDAVGDVFSPDIPLHRVGSWRQSVACRALLRLPAFHAQLKQQALRRISLLEKLNGISVLRDAAGQEGVWPVLMLQLPTQAQRDRAMATLWHSGLGVSRMFIHAVDGYDYLRAYIQPEAYPNAQALAARALTISNSPWLDDKRFEEVLAVLRSVV